jgi:hypothetical protein
LEEEDEGVKWTHLAQDGVKWLTAVKIVNIKSEKEGGKFLAN